MQTSQKMDGNWYGTLLFVHLYCWFLVLLIMSLVLTKAKKKVKSLTILSLWCNYVNNQSYNILKVFIQKYYNYSKIFYCKKRQSFPCKMYQILLHKRTRQIIRELSRCISASLSFWIVSELQGMAKFCTALYYQHHQNMGVISNRITCDSQYHKCSNFGFLEITSLYAVL